MAVARSHAALLLLLFAGSAHAGPRRDRSAPEPIPVPVQQPCACPVTLGQTTVFAPSLADFVDVEAVARHVPHRFLGERDLDVLGWRGHADARDGRTSLSGELLVVGAFPVQLGALVLELHPCHAASKHWVALEGQVGLGRGGAVVGDVRIGLTDVGVSLPSTVARATSGTEAPSLRVRPPHGLLWRDGTGLTHDKDAPGPICGPDLRIASTGLVLDPIEGRLHAGGEGAVDTPAGQRREFAAVAQGFEGVVFSDARVSMPLGEDTLVWRTHDLLVGTTGVAGTLRLEVERVDEGYVVASGVVRTLEELHRALVAAGASASVTYTEDLLHPGTGTITARFARPVPPEE